MRTKYKGPGGGGVLELADDATVGQLLEEIATKTGYRAFDVKLGWPPVTLDATRKDVPAKSLVHNQVRIVMDSGKLPGHPRGSPWEGEAARIQQEPPITRPRRDPIKAFRSSLTCYDGE